MMTSRENDLLQQVLYREVLYFQTCFIYGVPSFIYFLPSFMYKLICFI